jgi:RNAse (barnase) inhibitor barstar
MPIVRIDARRIHDSDTLHSVFAESLGFPAFYGRNMNAWIDCMSYLDNPDAGMTTVHGTASDPVVLHIEHINSLANELYTEIVDCAAFVNWRRLENSEPAILCLSFYRTER